MFRGAICIIMGSTQMLIDNKMDIEWMDKLMLESHDGTLCSSENKWSTTTCSNMNESHKHNVEWKKSEKAARNKWYMTFALKISDYTKTNRKHIPSKGNSIWEVSEMNMNMLFSRNYEYLLYQNMGCKEWQNIRLQNLRTDFEYHVKKFGLFLKLKRRLWRI